MAKFGESDPRWIVQDRVDGTNVNNWHWREKDCSEWSRERLGQLLAPGTLLVDRPDGVRVTSTGVSSLEGDVILNVRKNKLVASYELALKIGWEGSTGGEPGAGGRGSISLPYVADENHDEDPEVRVICDADDSAAAQLKQALLADGKQVVYKAIRQFVSELAAGGPTVGAAATPAAGANASGAGPASNGAPKTAASSAPAAASAKASSSSSSKSSRGMELQLTERFYARASDIFECFTQEGRLRAFTQSAAEVKLAPDGQFSWFGGSVQGNFITWEAPRHLEMRWRFSSWDDGVYSKVVIDLEEPEPGNTVLRLKQTGIPGADRFGNGDVREAVERGWKGQVLQRIRSVFGYGV